VNVKKATTSGNDSLMLPEYPK